MRQRKPAEPEGSSAPSAEPIDEGDQAQIVASLEKDGLQQIEWTNKIFSGICVLAMCGTAVMVVIHGNGLLPWSHALYSAAVYWMARIHVTTVTSDSLQHSMSSHNVVPLVAFAVSPLVVVAVLGLSLNESDTASLHWSLALANLLVVVCSILVRNENAKTIKEIKALEGSKYSFKSL